MGAKEQAKDQTSKTRNTNAVAVVATVMVLVMVIGETKKNSLLLNIP